jgi:hypothetical protein
VGGRRDVGDVGLADLGDGVQHVGELPGEEVELLVGHRKPGQVRQVGHLVSGQLTLRGRRAHSGWNSTSAVRDGLAGGPLLDRGLTLPLYVGGPGAPTA